MSVMEVAVPPGEGISCPVSSRSERNTVKRSTNISHNNLKAWGVIANGMDRTKVPDSWRGQFPSKTSIS